MGHLTYLGLLAGCLVVTAPLELVLRVRVYARWRRLLVAVLPVLDLRLRLGWGTTDPSARHVIIVVRIAEQLQGIIVDAVSDIVTLGPDDIQPVPEVGEVTATAFLEGIATIDDRLIMILGLDRLADTRAPLADAA